MLGFGAIAELPLATIPIVDTPFGVFPVGLGAGRRRPVQESVFRAPEAAGFDVFAVFPDIATGRRRVAPESVFEAPELPVPVPPVPPPGPVIPAGVGWEDVCLPPRRRRRKTKRDLACERAERDRLREQEQEQKRRREPVREVRLRQSIYNFAADVPAATRGRVVTLMETLEEQPVFVREARVFRSEEAVVRWGDTFEMQLRRAVVDVAFDSAEERDRAVDVALCQGFFALAEGSADGHVATLRLAAPPDLAFLPEALAALEKARAEAILAVQAERDAALAAIETARRAAAAEASGSPLGWVLLGLGLGLLVLDAKAEERKGRGRKG